MQANVAGRRVSYTADYGINIRGISSLRIKRWEHAAWMGPRSLGRAEEGCDGNIKMEVRT
jgi:hypothetical protein